MEDMNGIFYVTVESAENDYVLHWQGYADHPSDALAKALSVREEEIQNDPHANG